MDGKCKDCKQCLKLRVFKRRIREMGSNNILSGWKVDTMKNRYSDSFCCLVFNKYGYVVETNPEDNCELFEERSNA